MAYIWALGDKDFKFASISMFKNERNRWSYIWIHGDFPGRNINYRKKGNRNARTDEYSIEYEKSTR